MTYEQFLLKKDKMMSNYIKEDKLKDKDYSIKKLEADIQKLKDFRAKGFDLWQRDFYGLSIHESISACAVPLSSELRWVTKKINTRIITKYKRPTQSTHGHTDIFVGGEFIGYIMPDRICGGYTLTSKHESYPHMSAHNKKGMLAKIYEKAMIVVEF